MDRASSRRWLPMELKRDHEGDSVWEQGKGGPEGVAQRDRDVFEEEEDKQEDEEQVRQDGTYSNPVLVLPRISCPDVLHLLTDLRNANS